MILDTNAISALADRDADLLAVLNGVGRAFLSYVSVAEFRFGLFGSKKGEPGIAFLDAQTAGMPTLCPDAQTVDSGRIAVALAKDEAPPPGPIFPLASPAALLLTLRRCKPPVSKPCSGLRRCSRFPSMRRRTGRFFRKGRRRRWT